MRPSEFTCAWDWSPKGAKINFMDLVEFRDMNVLIRIIPIMGYPLITLVTKEGGRGQPKASKGEGMKEKLNISYAYLTAFQFDFIKLTITNKGINQSLLYQLNYSKVNYDDIEL